MRGSSWGCFMRLKPEKCFVRLVPFPTRLISADWTWLLAEIELCNELFECLNDFPCLAVIQHAQHISGNNSPHAYLSFSPSLHAPSISASSLPPSLSSAAGVQGEALREEVCVVPHRLVRRQLVQDQRPGYQLHSGEHDRGRGGTCDHRDCHAESWDRPRRLQHGGNTRKNKNAIISPTAVMIQLRRY